MNITSLSSFIAIFIFSLGFNSFNLIIKNSAIDDSVIDSSFFPNEPIDPISYTFIEKEIKYYAPQSGFVYLAWTIEKVPLNESVVWNADTKLVGNLLYNPMIAHSDTFAVRLKVPVGSTFRYSFWITKNKLGHYQDFWDLQSSGKTIVTDDYPITKNAIYTKVEKQKGFNSLSLGLPILLSLIILYLFLKWIERRSTLKKLFPSEIEKVLYMGISMGFFHALARAEIINVYPISILYHPTVIARIIKASFYDFLFIGGLIFVFVLIFKLFRNAKIRKLFYGFFIFLALFSTLVAYTNITTVIFLGKPFTYQWLYYSDFLGSTEARTALQENLSLWTMINLMAFCLSLLILAKVIRSLYGLLKVPKKVEFSFYSLLGVGLIVLFTFAYKSQVTWTKGQSENAITSMIHSMLNANSNSSFFTAKIPDDMEPFNPAQGKKLERSFMPMKEHNVKNVLFIVLESAGATYFDYYGGNHQLSPNLNKYASHALIFDQMYAHAPATNRSLVSILGSMYPYLSYKSLTQEAPDFRHETLSSILKNEGYRTSFFSSADLRFQNCRKYLSNRGFDLIEDFSDINCKDSFQLESNNYKEGNGIDDICLADRLISWLDADTTRNFFSMIWTVQGHYPYFFAKEEEDFGVSNYSFNRYLNCLKHDDELIGIVMQALEDRGLDTTTLVVIFGDHGEAFGQHKQFGHGTAIYEENIKVPLYFINPNLFHGEHKNDIAGMKDLASTTLSILGIDIPQKWQGRDLLSTDENEAFFFAPWSDYLFGYRKENMKYIFNESQNTVEVYDLLTDPNERINLFHPDMKSEIANARGRIAAWVQFQNQFIKEIREK